jgi:class 3 adenylate cyclase/tetratricopeptide (TPR) repeat protein
MSAGPVGTARKVVTVLFTDITGSTGLGHALDPESLQHMLSRYFEEMKVIVERHGGVVSKFIGDAVMAIFGIPRVHEDDALRAVRAAVEMRDAIARLNEEFASAWGVRVAVRTGVNTGEVLASESDAAQALIVGDAVNTAARLEQTADPGEILVGEDTYRLVFDAVSAEAVGPLELRGRDAPVTAWRLLAVEPDTPGWSRRLDSPLVGRDAELARLRDAFDHVAATRACEVVTVMGPAGVGKSRLTEEALARIDSRATILRGRCVAYGEGMTFWPVASVLREATGLGRHVSPDEARSRVTGLLAGEGGSTDGETGAIADGLAALLGVGAEPVGVQETYWAVRKLLERLAGRRPLVVVFDDIHWGEDTFLDLLEYLADWIRDAPVLVVCQTRPDLLDARPAWMSAKPNASLVSLLPLDETQTDSLMRALVGGADLPPEARSRIAALAEGNPLFVEETLRMLVDAGALHSRDGRWTVSGDLSAVTIPPTINALVTARLDRLEPEQRAVIERGSAIGRSFWWGAVSELSPEDLRPRVGASIQALVRKQLIEPDRSQISQEDAFRFTHILIRDAAYRAIPKVVRADMHDRLADWIAARTGDLAGEYQQLVGYHLDQAHRLLLELGAPTPRSAALGQRASEQLGAAGERAFARGDMPAAVKLLSRATELLPARDARRLELLTELAFALMETGDFDRLVAVAEEVRVAGTATGDIGLQAHAIVLGLWIRLFTRPAQWADEAEREARRAVAAFGELRDERGLSRAWSLLGLVHVLRARFGAAEEALRRAVEHARVAGDRREALEGLSWIPLTVWAGPTPAEEGVRRCGALLEEAQGDKKAMSSALFAQAGFEASLGRFAEARTLLGRARALLEEVALPVWEAGPLAQYAGWTELLAGDPQAAERELRWGYDTLAAIGEVSWLSTVAGILAEAVHQQGAHDDAERYARVAQETAGAEDVFSHALWRSVRGKVLAHRGAHEEACELTAAAVELAATTDFPHLRWHALMSHAETLRVAGRPADAEAALREAMAVAERKGLLAGARLAREALG